jgi:hypothetical protein
MKFRSSRAADESHRRAWAATACGLLLALPLMTACSQQPASCAGQCGPPYQLDVRFSNAGTSKAVATKALQSCSTFPAVTRTQVVAVPPGRGSGWEGRVYTSKLGRDARTGPLLDCLNRQPGVTSAGWPS